MVVSNCLHHFAGRPAQVLAVICATLMALSDGMQYGWTSPISTILLSTSSPVPATKADIVFLEIIYMIGGLFGIPFSICLIDRVGRKNTLLISAVESLIAWILIGVSSSVKLLYVARFISGLSADVNFVSTPIYIAEISDKHIRGRLGSLIYVMMMLGIVLIYTVGPYVTLSVSSTVGACILVLQLLTFSFMPESPYFYLLTNRKEEARKSLQIFRSTKDVEEELDQIDEGVKKDNLNRGNILDMFRVRSNLKAVLIMTVLNTAQHFSGISVMFMNMHLILEDSASVLTANVAAIIFSVLMLMSSAVSGIVIDKVGRKVLLNTSSFLTGISLLALASYFTVKNTAVDVRTFNWVPVFAVMMYALTYKYGLGLVPIVMTAELFPTNIKAYGVTLSDLVYIVASVLSILLFHILQTTFSMDVPFYLFGFFCMLSCLFSIFVIPETRGKTLEEIQTLLKEHTSVKKVSNRSNSSITLTSHNMLNNYGTNKN